MKGLFIALLVTFLFSLALSAGNKRSSHSEAPGTASIPNSDITDLYAFRSYEAGRSNYVTFLLNVYPLQSPYGGPNYFSLSTEHFYELYIDADNDGIEDYSFQWIYGNSLPSSGPQGYPLLFQEDLQCQPSYSFNNTPIISPTQISIGVNLNISTATTASQAVAVALKVIGPVVGSNGIQLGYLNWEEYYSLYYLSGQVGTAGSGTQIQSTSGTTKFDKPFDYAGEASFGTATQYEAYARNYITNISLSGIASCGDSDTGRVFVGQRSDPFWISLGRIFDFLNMVPVQLPQFSAYTIAQCATNNDLREKNVDVLALEIPIACVNTGSSGIIYVWSGTRNLYHVAGDDSAHIAGPQVSRLGNPLVNELVIGLIDKDRFSRQHPSFDADPKIGFGTYVFYPTFPAIIDIRYNAAVNSILGASIANLAPPTPRQDLALTFLEGIPGLNQAVGPNGLFVGEVMRLNLGVTAVPWGGQNPLGVVGAFLSGNLSDLAGFPNGRRPGDDVVDIALDVMMGVLCTTAFTSKGFYLCNNLTAGPIAGVLLTDGSPVKDTNYGKTFPYLSTPTPGSYLDGVTGSVVQDPTICYPASQHGRCAPCAGASNQPGSSSSNSPSTGSSASKSPAATGDGGDGGNPCSGAGRIGGFVMSLLKF